MSLLDLPVETEPHPHMAISNKLFISSNIVLCLVKSMTGTVKVEDENLVFELHGIDEILSIKRSLSVALKDVKSVSTDRVPWAPFKQLKISGARIPGVVKDGRYLSSDGMMFFEMHDPDKCITVYLKHERYKAIVFEVENKEATATMINDAITSANAEKPQ
jgi:hypothetical protein